jgi:hypothetical protein
MMTALRTMMMRRMFPPCLLAGLSDARARRPWSSASARRNRAEITKPLRQFDGRRRAKS